MLTKILILIIIIIAVFSLYQWNEISVLEHKQIGLEKTARKYYSQEIAFKEFRDSARLEAARLRYKNSVLEIQIVRGLKEK